MLHRLFHHLRLIVIIAGYSLMGSLEYRFQTFVRIIRIFVESATVLFVISTFFQHTKVVAGLRQEDIMLIFATFNITWATIYFFISDNLQEIGEVIRRGNLDFFLLKPVDNEFLIACNQMHPQNLIRVGIGIAIIIYSVNSLHLIISPFNFLLYLMTVFSGMFIGFSLLLLIAVLSFWTFAGEIYELANTTFSIARYPISIFPRGVIIIFTIVPIIFITTVPTRALLGKIDGFVLLSPIIALISIIISRRFLFFALRRYQSASS